jgi:hypothetical protein
VSNDDEVIVTRTSSGPPRPPYLLPENLAAIKAEAIERAKAAAWDEGVRCPHCNGDGKLPGGRRLIHSVSPAGMGADWEVESVVEAIEKSERVAWIDSIWGHNLAVEVDGKTYRFEVSNREGI